MKVGWGANGTSPANNTSPLQILPEQQEAEKFRIMIDSYLKIVIKNINDIVPKTIMYFIIENMKKFVKHDLLCSLTELSKEEKNKRDELLRMREALEEALDTINSMASFTSIE